jgi:predicted transcriptional regulator
MTEYSFSFTGSNAQLQITCILAREYLRLLDWEKTKTIVGDQNLMNKVKKSTFIREFREIRKRLVLLTPSQIDLVANGSSDESKAMVFLSVIKLYSFIREFYIEVVRRKYMFFENAITAIDFNEFVKSKAVSHPELSSLTDSSMSKVRTVLFRMLEETNMINSVKDGLILKPYLSNDAISAITGDDPRWLSWFLYTDAEINSLKAATNHE